MIMKYVYINEHDTAEKPSILRIRIRKWKWIGQPLSKAVESTEKQHWTGIHMQPPEEDQSKPRKGPFCRKQENAAKHAGWLRGLRVTESDGDASQMPYVPNGRHKF